MAVTKEFEIHLASDVISPELASILSKLGYSRDAFIGGTTGVVHPCHFTIDPQSQKEMDDLWQNSIDILGVANKEEFYSYAEAEITPSGYRIELPYKEFVSGVLFPIKPLEFERKRSFRAA